MVSTERVMSWRYTGTQGEENNLLLRIYNINRFKWNTRCEYWKPFHGMDTPLFCSFPPIIEITFFFFFLLQQIHHSPNKILQMQLPRHPLKSYTFPFVLHIQYMNIWTNINEYPLSCHLCITVNIRVVLSLNLTH